MPKQKTKTDAVLDCLPTIEEVQAANDAGFEVGTVRMLIVQLGSNKDTIGRNLLRLQERGQAHIHRHTAGNPPRAVWVAGAGVSAELVPMTEAERAQRKNESAKRAALRRKEREASGIKSMNQNLTPVLEMQRTMRTVENARAAPRTWFAPLAELQAHSEVAGPLLVPPVARRGRAQEQSA